MRTNCIYFLIHINFLIAYCRASKALVQGRRPATTRPLLRLTHHWSLPQPPPQMAADHLPSPRAAAPDRLPRLLPPQGLALGGHAADPALQQALAKAEAALRACSTDPEAPCVVYVSKMVAVPAGALPR